MMSVEEVVVTALLFSWVIFVAAVLTRKLYGWMRKGGVEQVLVGEPCYGCFFNTRGHNVGFSWDVRGAVASFIEHYEYKPIDDNITVPLVSFVILMLAKTYAPWTLMF